MGLDILRLAAALGLGLGLGLLYDLFRPLRRRVRPLHAAVMDLLFSALAFAAVFCYGMSSRSGLMGLWELAAALLGFALYIQLFSAFICPRLDGLLAGLCSLRRLISRKLKKSAALTKKVFQKVRECFIIRK